MLAILAIFATTVLAFWFYKKKTKNLQEETSSNWRITKVQSGKTSTHTSAKPSSTAHLKIKHTNSDLPQTPLLDSSRKLFQSPGSKSSFGSQQLAEVNFEYQNHSNQIFQNESQVPVERQIPSELTSAPSQIIDKPSPDVITARSVVNDQPTDGVSTARDISITNEKTEDVFTAKEVSTTLTLTEETPTARSISTTKSLHHEDQGSDMKDLNKSLPKTPDITTQAKERKVKKSQKKSISTNKETREKSKGKKRSKSSKSKIRPQSKEPTETIQNAQ